MRRRWVVILALAGVAVAALAAQAVVRDFRMVPSEIETRRDTVFFRLQPEDGIRCSCVLTQAKFGCGCAGSCGVPL